uniref:ATPase associated with various cellular activities, AAA_5 n=1 Tax=Solibacter usitatus (strain Ellin6076) TaxID=234267 RepID=Q027Y4_SOLUE
MGKTSVTEDPAAEPAGNRILERLGIVGMESVEPVILAALIQRDPLLLIGPHGTGKSYLLNRLAASLRLQHRHYNASLLNFDDLVGYPLPNGSGGLDYIQTPAAIWGAQSVFIDEISRCRPEVQNKLFSIVHERCVQGLPLRDLVYRWSAMNPPAGDDGDSPYAGSEPLDRALADRFAFILDIPDWQRLGQDAQERLILTADMPLDSAAALRLPAALETGRRMAARIRDSLSEVLARYVRIVCALLRQANLVLSPRRAVMLLRNIAGVHAARLLDAPDADPAASAFLALRHSLPQRATGEAVNETSVLAAHKEAWKSAGVPKDSPIHVLMAEPDPLHRALAAVRCASLGKREFSTVVCDCLAGLAPGARHALAAHLFESGAAGRLVAAVAEQAAAWYGVTATPQSLNETVHAGGSRHRVWQQVLSRLGRLDRDDPETPAATNLLVGLFASSELTAEGDPGRVLEAWQTARRTIAGTHS